MLQREAEFPWGTLTANLLGCLAMGVIAQLISSTAWFNASGLIPEQYRLLFAIGFCGSFTTLSSLVMEMNTMIQRDEIFYSFSYFVATLLGGFACFYLGIMSVRIIMQLQSS
jgi:CrcB protein